MDPTPLASASIAQVHVGRLLNGTEVVIKVQKPGIEEVLKTDLGVVYLASRILEFINPDLNIRGSLADIASDLRESMLGELDFREEQRNLDVYREFLSSNGLDPLAVAPQPFPEASAKRVLTMERLTGVPLTDLEAIKRYSNDPEQTLVNALNVWALSVQKCEFFHADVHAGNLLVLEDGRVGFIDFGIVGRLSPKMATGIDKLNEALAVSDARGMAQALISMGATVGKVDEDAFAADIQQLIAQLGGSLENATDATVDESQIQDIVLDIAQVAGNNGLKLPREFGLLIKQSLYFDRYTKLLAPELNMMSDDRISKFGAAEDVESGGEIWKLMDFCGEILHAQKRSKKGLDDFLCKVSKLVGWRHIFKSHDVPSICQQQLPRHSFLVVLRVQKIKKTRASMYGIFTYIYRKKSTKCR